MSSAAVEISMNASSGDIHMHQLGSLDVHSSLSEVEENNDTSASYANDDTSNYVIGHQHIVTNNIDDMNHNINRSSNTVINTNVRSRVGRAILSAALPGTSYPCGCGCEKSYDGLAMVTCRGCSQLYVNKRCNVTWKCGNCSV